MFSHNGIWSAIDHLAQSLGTSTSGLAKRAGLDPTSFNKSKRIGSDGKQRWPSTESIARVLSSVNMTLSEFLQFLPADENNHAQTIPMITSKDTAKKNMFDDFGFPHTLKTTNFDFPDVMPAEIFALEISDDAYAPTYRKGDILIISPPAPLRRGDRVVVKTHAHVIVGELVRKSSTKLDILPFFDKKTMQFDTNEIVFVSRILWATQ